MAEGEFLVNLARKAISNYLSENKMIKPPEDTLARLNEKLGVFVTLKNYSSGELRGCIGFPEPVEILAKATITSAIEAATGDPRFPKVTLKELEEDIVVEISVLTIPQEIKSEPKDIPEHISIGTDGLIIGRGLQRGLLLPQVAVEWEWDKEEFLANCCLKAGLPTDSWLLKGSKVFTFKATIFRERSPKGIVEKVLQEKVQP
ncbi:MAG: TIGR00296 family protein [Candidatus Bathyarchaeia archaeon]|nr:TIGR00296 family protein [Candidatus Bathyarchaeota archaeon]